MSCSYRKKRTVECTSLEDCRLNDGISAISEFGLYIFLSKYGD